MKNFGALALTLIAFGTGCGTAKWSEQGALNPGIETGNKAPQKLARQFEVTVKVDDMPSKPLDIVWVVDNSSSMQAEAAHVRNNIQSFGKYVMARAEIGFTLISQKGATGTNVTLPLLAPTFSQLSHYVWSTDALEILAAAICDATPQSGTACGQIRANARTTNISKVAAQLQPRLRVGTKKIFVIVTDDESRISSDLFFAAYQEKFPDETPAVFGFIGVDATQSPCATKPSVEYIKLAQSTGGEVFNVCDSDWSPHFKRLAEMSVRHSVSAVALPPEILNGGRILTVEVNGSLIPDTLYTVTSEGLVLDPKALPKSGELTVRVGYEVTGL